MRCLTADGHDAEALALLAPLLVAEIQPTDTKNQAAVVSLPHVGIQRFHQTTSFPSFHRAQLHPFLFPKALNPRYPPPRKNWPSFIRNHKTSIHSLINKSIGAPSSALSARFLIPKPDHPSATGVARLKMLARRLKNRKVCTGWYHRARKCCICMECGAR